MPQTGDEPPGRRERKRQQQLDHIADTAWALFEAEGFEAVTMERIAEAADLSKVTLYRHFPVKEALLRHVFHRELRAAWPDIQPELAWAAPGRARLARFLELQAAWCESRRAFLLPYTRFRLSDSRLPAEGRERSGMEAIFSELIAQGQAAGEFRADLPVALLAMHLQFAHLATLLRCLTDDRLALADELATMLDLVCNGMGGRS
ncbi:TetR/AcrR family transcriptional regulator [Dechloromonas hortensis]|uniref:TetR/AcrR family transcriptional regulator n=1 Tax=Dechloromonas hortensis TaxID=337779 RepID=UPI001B886B05|nr:TetR/AcrR family transcriptional regulator [Dechloromonas hortensis]